MDEALKYLIDSLQACGIPVLVAVVLGFFAGYAFFRSRSKDERDSIATIKESNKVLEGEVKSGTDKLRAAEERNRELSSTVEELTQESERLRSDFEKAKSREEYWKSKALGKTGSAEGPLDEALNIFTQ